MIGQSGCPKDHLLFIWKDKISKNLILTKFLIYLLRREKETHFKTSFFKEKKKLSSNYVRTWSSMREVHRQSFQRLGHNHPKRNFISKKIFQNFIFFPKLCFQTMSGLDPLWERYVGSIFKGLVTITQKETSFQKRFFKTSFFFKTLFSNYIWTWSFMKEVCWQLF